MMFTSPLRALSGSLIARSTSSLRLSSASVWTRTHTLTRSFSSTPLRQASESPSPSGSNYDLSSLASSLKSSPIFKAIQGNEKALGAVRDIGKILKDKGYETTKPPGQWEMMKLAMDKDFREASMVLFNELKAAGIELTPETVAELMKGGGAGGSSGSSEKK